MVVDIICFATKDRAVAHEFSSGEGLLRFGSDGSAGSWLSIIRLKKEK